jgi:uncharacterized membrane protein YfcA
MDLMTPAMGFVVGFFVGLTGMGGGALMTPLLVLTLGVSPTVAVGTDLAYAALTKAVGAWQHWRQDTIEPRLVLYLAGGSLPASLLAVGIVRWLQKANWTGLDQLMSRLLASVLVVVAISLGWRALVDPQEELGKLDVLPVRYPTSIVLIGALGGLMVGFTSVGAGTLVMALLSIFYRDMSPVRLVGSDILHGSLLACTAALAHMAIGHLDLNLLFGLLIGSVPGVLLGSHLVTKAPGQILRLTLALLILVSAVKLV